MLVNDKKSQVPRILLCVSGSVASVKIPEIVINFSKVGDVQVVCTMSAMHFIHCSGLYNSSHWDEFNKLGGMNKFFINEEVEWKTWNKMKDKVLHIELQKWADIIVVLPASADLVAKLSAGIADNFVLSILRAWDLKKPCLLFPTMNTNMWNHPSTAANLDQLKRYSAYVTLIHLLIVVCS